MASTDFLPTREAELVTWSTNFEARIAATPAAFGLTAAQGMTYSGLHAAFVAAYNLARNDATNSRSATVAKNAAKAALVADARMLAGIVQKFPGTTDTQRADLGLTIPATPAPIPPPAESPIIDVESRQGTAVSIRLHDGTGSRRGKPAGVAGASVFTFVGPTPPADVAGWKFYGNTTRTGLDVAFDPALAPGTAVWMTAFWYNPRGQSGPGCTPVGAILAGGGMAWIAA